MEALLIYIVKMILCSGVMFLYYQLLLKDKTFHHYNRFYLMMILLVSLLLPLIKIDYFTIDVSPKVFQFMSSLQEFKNLTPTQNEFNYYQLIFSAIGLVSLVLLGRLMYGIFMIFRFKKQFNSQELFGIEFYTTDLLDAPFSFFRNLFWKEEIALDSPVGKQILKHEMVHIEQKHSIDKLGSELIVALFWFNPFFHVIKKELSLIHEYLADKKSVKNSDTKAFAQMLLASHFTGKVFPATSPFLNSNLKKRLKMLQQPKTKYSYARRLLALPTTFVLVFAYMVDAQNTEIKEFNEAIAIQANIVNSTIEDTPLVNSAEKVTATISSNNPGESFANKLKKSGDKSLYIINGDQVSKKEFEAYYSKNKDKTNVTTSYSNAEHHSPKLKENGVLGPYGEFEKYGVFQIDEIEKLKSTQKKYHSLQDKYAPEWRQYLKKDKNNGQDEPRSKVDLIIVKNGKVHAINRDGDTNFSVITMDAKNKNIVKLLNDKKSKSFILDVKNLDSLKKNNDLSELQFKVIKDHLANLERDEFAKKDLNEIMRYFEITAKDLAKFNASTVTSFKSTTPLSKKDEKKLAELSKKQAELRSKQAEIAKEKALILKGQLQEDRWITSKISKISTDPLKSDPLKVISEMEDESISYYLNNKKISKDDFQELKPDNIESINVFKSNDNNKKTGEIRIKTK